MPLATMPDIVAEIPPSRETLEIVITASAIAFAPNTIKGRGGSRDRVRDGLTTGRECRRRKPLGR